MREIKEFRNDKEYLSCPFDGTNLQTDWIAKELANQGQVLYNGDEWVLLSESDYKYYKVDIICNSMQIYSWCKDVNPERVLRDLLGDSGKDEDDCVYIIDRYRLPMASIAQIFWEVDK